MMKNSTTHPVRGVALMIRNRFGEILLVKELEEKAWLGKYRGMLSLPMETLLNQKEPHCAVVERLLKEEIPWLVGHMSDFPEWRGDYRVAPMAWVSLYATWTYRIDTPDHPIESHEIGGYVWATAQEALTFWLRQGVREMITDYLEGLSGVRRLHYLPATRPCVLVA